MIDIKAFCEKYKALGGVLSGYFHDSDDEESDEALAARIIAQELDHPETTRRLVADSEGVLQNIDREWSVLGKTANRHFDDAGDARRWLSGVYAVWEAALRKHRGTKPS